MESRTKVCASRILHTFQREGAVTFEAGVLIKLSTLQGA